MKKLFIKALIMLAILVIILSVLDGLVSVRDHLMAKKLNALSLQSTRVDSVFVGASAIYRDFDPALFDRFMRQRGYTSTSFNFGLPAMSLLEIQYMLERFLIPTLPHLKIIFLDPNFLRIDIDERNRYAWRTIHYHDLQRTLTAIRATVHSKKSFKQKLDLMKMRLEFFFKHISLAGEGENIVRSAVRRGNGRRRDFSRLAHYNGHLPLDEERDTVFKARNAFFLSPQGLAEYHELLATTYRADSSDRTFHREQVLAVDLLLKMIRAFARRGIQVVIIDPPVIVEKQRRQFIVAELKRRWADAVVIEMDSPDKYPELFSVKHRFDKAHLNHEGARLATRELADRVCQLGAFSPSL